MSSILQEYLRKSSKHLGNSKIYGKKLFDACLYNSLLIPSDPGSFLAFNAFIDVSNSSIVIKGTQFSVNFARFPSVVLSLNCLVRSFC